MSTPEKPPTPQATLDANKAIVLKMMEAFNTGNQAVVEELIDPHLNDKSQHLGLDPEIRAMGPVDNLKGQIAMDREVVPDGKFEVLSIIAEGDQVVLHWQLTGTNTGPVFGRPATGKKLNITGTEFVTVRNGKIVEHDDAGYHALEAFRQLGLITSPVFEERPFK